MKLAERMSRWRIAEREGCAVRIAGASLSANPYQVKDKALACYWDQGWSRATVEPTTRGDLKIAGKSDAVLSPIHG